MVKRAKRRVEAVNVERHAARRIAARLFRADFKQCDRLVQVDDGTPPTTGTYRSSIVRYYAGWSEPCAADLIERELKLYKRRLLKAAKEAK